MVCLRFVRCLLYHVFLFNKLLFSFDLFDDVPIVVKTLFLFVIFENVSRETFSPASREAAARQPARRQGFFSAHVHLLLYRFNQLCVYFKKRGKCFT